MKIATIALSNLLSLVLSHSASAFDTVSNEEVETINKAPRTQTINFDEVLFTDPTQGPPATYRRNEDTGVRFDNTVAIDGLRLIDFLKKFGIPVEDETGLLKGASSAPNFAAVENPGQQIFAECGSGFLRVKSVKVMPLLKIGPPDAPPTFLAPPPFTLLITGYDKGGKAIAQKQVFLDISEMNGPKRVKFGKKFKKLRKVSFEVEHASETRPPTFELKEEASWIRTATFEVEQASGKRTPTFDDLVNRGDDASLVLFAIDDLKVKVKKACK